MRIGFCVAVVAMAGMMAGCHTVMLTSEERQAIDANRANNVTWSQNPPEGYVQPVKMVPAIFWGILPGAGQHFIAHKAHEAGLNDELRLSNYRRLRFKGTVMIAFSWIPFVYDVTLPCGIGGIITDVNRINNLAVLKRQAEMSQERGGCEAASNHLQSNN